MKKKIVEIAVKVIVAALTAFLTAITTTSCMGYGPLPKIVKISLMKNPLAVAGGFFVENITLLQYYITDCFFCKGDYSCCRRAIYLPRMSNSRLTTVPMRMSQKLVCSKV